MMIRPISGNTAAQPAGGDDRLKAICQEFEAILLQQLMKQMRSSARALSGEEPSAERAIYEEMQDAETVKDLGHTGGVGLSEMLYRQLQARQIGDTER